MSNKALFVMNMPECCVDCIFCFEIDEGIEACCTITGVQDNEDKFRAIKEDYCQCRPDWCPLKPVPEKKPVVLDTLDSFYNGWNACIDEILEVQNE